MVQLPACAYAMDHGSGSHEAVGPSVQLQYIRITIIVETPQSAELAPKGIRVIQKGIRIAHLPAFDPCDCQTQHGNVILDMHLCPTGQGTCTIYKVRVLLGRRYPFGHEPLSDQATMPISGIPRCGSHRMGDNGNLQMSWNSEGYFPVVGDKHPHQSTRNIQRVYLLELAFGAADTLYSDAWLLRSASCCNRRTQEIGIPIETNILQQGTVEQVFGSQAIPHWAEEMTCGTG